MMHPHLILNNFEDIYEGMLKAVFGGSWFSPSQFLCWSLMCFCLDTGIWWGFEQDIYCMGNWACIKIHLRPIIRHIAATLPPRTRMFYHFSINCFWCKICSWVCGLLSLAFALVVFFFPDRYSFCIILFWALGSLGPIITLLSLN